MFIEFKDVSFKYYGSDEYVFNQLSFAIEKGSMLAILGHNGSGKSTIAKLMMGLLETNIFEFNKHAITSSFLYFIYYTTFYIFLQTYCNCYPIIWEEKTIIYYKIIVIPFFIYHIYDCFIVYAKPKIIYTIFKKKFVI